MDENPLPEVTEEEPEGEIEETVIDEETPISETGETIPSDSEETHTQESEEIENGEKNQEDIIGEED